MIPRYPDSLGKTVRWRVWISSRARASVPAWGTARRAITLTIANTAASRYFMPARITKEESETLPKTIHCPGNCAGIIIAEQVYNGHRSWPHGRNSLLQSETRNEIALLKRGNLRRFLWRKKKSF